MDDEEIADLLSDVILWFHGYREARPDSMLHDGHLRALRQAKATAEAAVLTKSDDPRRVRK